MHFSYQEINQTLSNFKRSGATYLLTTNFQHCEENVDIVTGDWPMINLTKSPFNFPVPLQIINESCSQNNGLYQDKSLALWRLDEISR